jgi:hypothetical protein
MSIPVPTWNFMFWMIIFSVFLVGSRLVTVFTPLYLMRQGHRISLLPAINLCQMSELSLVLLAMGAASGDVSNQSIGIAAFAFAFLAIDSTYAVFQNDLILKKTVPWLNKLRIRDLPQLKPESAQAQKSKRIFLLGFFWTASSLLEEVTREKPALLPDLAVVDFNPNVNERLRRRGVHVVYGDIAQRDTLIHAGVAHAEIVVCSLPNSILKGASNLKLLRQVRELNTKAKIIIHAEKLTDIPALYAAGADYVTAPRLLEAADLLNVLDAAEKNLLEDKRLEQADQLDERDEVIP